MNKVVVILIAMAIVAGVFIMLRKYRGTHIDRQKPDFGNVDDLHELDEIEVPMSKPRLMQQDGIECTQVAHGADYEVVVINLFAKQGQQFAGYELLQALLAAGMRFGEMSIFHRYERDKGTILFSLACATEPGTFDVHKMGGFSCTGLTLFMHLSGHSGIDLERFNLLMETAEQLAEDLNGELLDQQRRLLTPQVLAQYEQRIQLRN